MESAPAPSQKENLKSNFIFEKIDGPNKSMKEFAKMVILLALEEYPNPENDWDKCLLVSQKFSEKYGGKWCASFIKEGDCTIWYDGYYFKIKYKDYTIKIGKTPNT